MIQLKLKTEYSFGQTFAPIDRIIERLKEQGCTAAGIVDSSTWGHVRWHEACREAGIKPLLGVEMIVSDIEDKTPKMWFIARNAAGLKELYNFTSLSHQQKVKTRWGSLPRLFRDDILAMSGDIIKFAGDITDEEFLFNCNAVLDLSPVSRILNIKKKQINEQKPQLQMVEVCDNAYVYPEDEHIFELASKAGRKPTPQHIPNALAYQSDAERVAETCFDYELPVAPMIHMEGDLEALCRDGIKFRGMEESWTQEYEDRLNYELELIRSKDFDSYFLVVADMVHFAKKHMLVGPSRGSSAGSLVCYLTRITEIDPIPPGLYFERFIDISRSDLPDIDLDFPDSKRHIVFEYMAEKYGFENTAHIGTIGKYKPRSALIQVCKALNIPPSATGAVKTAMIERSSADARATNCLEDTFNTTEAGRKFIEMYPQATNAMKLEGHAAQTGVHAAGLLVCNDQITNYATVDADGIAHIEKGAAEKLGLLKIDVLGLRTLGILEDSGVEVDWYNLPFDDPLTFDIFNSGRLCGIFQFEGNALRSIAHAIKFETINEIDAVTALARPGPFAGGVTQKYIARRNGEAYEPIHPIVEKYMDKTYGLPVYQEQTIAIVKEIGKFGWKETTTIRKAMAKSMGVEFFDKYWEKFKAGAVSQGINEEDAKKTWEMINAMGSWQMNKAHTFSYSVISYWTAWLKAHHPLSFAAANLRNAKDEDSAIELLREYSREGITYVPFDVRHSEKNWSVKDGVLYGGFMALKGVGEKKAEKLVAERNDGGLTKKNLETVALAENVFEDIFPMHSNYQDMYDRPWKYNIPEDIVEISDLEYVPKKQQRVFIAELIHKNARNANEDAEIKKRGGKVETEKLEYLDLRFRDDTGVIGGRIGRWDYEKWGRDLLENVPVGAHLLIRAVFYHSKEGEFIHYAFVKKWKRLDSDE